MSNSDCYLNDENGLKTLDHDVKSHDARAGPSPNGAASFWAAFGSQVIRNDPINVITNKMKIDPNIAGNFAKLMHESHFISCSELSQTLDNDSLRRNIDETVECKSFVVRLLSRLQLVAQCLFPGAQPSGHSSEVPHLIAQTSPSAK
jgi:hypothetical protein